MLTSEHNAFMLMAHFRSGTRELDGTWSYSLQNCIDQFIERFPDMEFDYDTFRQHKHNIVHRFEQKNCICKGKAPGRPTLLTEDTVEDIQVRMERSPNKSISTLAAQTELKEQLEKQRLELGRQLQEKVKVFEMYDQKMETVTENFKIEMKHCLRASEKQMMQKCLESEEKQYDLADEADEIVKKYETILKDNLNEEKKARSKRLKIETQLQNWINTFDQDIGDKHEQHEELLGEFNETNGQKEHMEKLLEEQEPEYKTSMQEKADEEERIFNELAYQFYLDRCAKTIQRYWRMYVEKRLAAKTKRRGKKKKT